MTKPVSATAPQPGAAAGAGPRWAQPLRVHLGVAMVALLVAIAGAVMASAVRRAATEATRLPGLPAARDLR